MEQSLQTVLDFVLREQGWEPSPNLTRLASHLPPITCAGLELHLGQDKRIDLQQRVKTPLEWQRLQRFLRTTRIPDQHPSWMFLARFCGQCDAREIASELWLELDDDPAQSLPPLSLFARLAEGDCVNGSAEAAILRFLSACGVELSRSAYDAIKRCLAGCPEGAGVPFVGMMFGRMRTPLCLVIDKIPATGFGDFLEQAGLGHRATMVQRQVDALFVDADRIRLILTITDHLEDVLGLECFVGDPTVREPRWSQLFDHLARTGLCTPDAHRRLLSWPKQILPHQAQQDWPGILIAQSLGEGPENLSWIDCRISHVKLSLRGDGCRAAKVYIGFRQETCSLKKPSEDPKQFASSPQQVVPRDEMIRRAADALLQARTQAGWWLDYSGFSEGISDEWVTAYVANACCETGIPQLQAAAIRAWSLLSGRSRDGWGWNFVQPADADSTAWALRLAHALGRLHDPRAQQGLGFLKRHIGADGSAATYLEDSHATDFPDLAINPAWHHAHLCVTAALAGLAPVAEMPRAYLQKNQAEDGAWRGYWWADDAYATATAALALSASADPAAAKSVMRAAHYAHKRLEHDQALSENPFVLALLLRTALLLDGADARLLQQRCSILAASCHPNGMWPGSATLRIPSGKGASKDAMDQNGIFTTATVLVTLTSLRKAGVLP